MKNKIIKYNIDKMYEKLCIYKGGLNILENCNSGALFDEYVPNCKTLVLDKIVKEYDLHINRKDIKKILNDSKDESHCINNYFRLYKRIYHWSEKNFLYQEYMNTAFTDDTILLLLKEISNINSILTGCENDIYSFLKNIASNILNNNIERLDEKRNTYIIAYYIKELDKKTNGPSRKINNNLYIEMFIENAMFKCGYTIRRYITDEKIYELVKTISTSNIEELETKIIGIYLSNYEQIVNEIVKHYNELRKCHKRDINEYYIKNFLKESENEYIPKEKIMNKFSNIMSEITIKRKLLALRKKGEIERIGEKKNSKYKYCGGIK